MKNYYSNGKLLITGEYVVLDGALSLAVPTKFGQSLIIEPINAPKISCTSYNNDGSVWFEDSFFFDEIASNNSKSRNAISQKLIQILNVAKKLNPKFLDSNTGFKIFTHLTFPKNWGLGTSSTLINNVAEWANVDPFELLKQTFGGSGYDIACAQHNTPITYQLHCEDDMQGGRSVDKIHFNPIFKKHLYFVYLNKKQNSREGIAIYKANRQNTNSTISEINDITLKAINSKTLEEFEVLMDQHEDIISKIIKQKTVKSLLFSDFNGSMKSLGAWGGDFILVASKENSQSYFKEKGFDVIVPYDEMVLAF